MTIELDEFGWNGLRQEADRQGVPLERLVEHAAMYYLADIHSGRAAVRIFRCSHDGGPHGSDGGSVTPLPPGRFARRKRNGED